ncbi:hypothetical protein [Anaplasma centrale]|uniref:hypothetical protein n=1 Tax=Anaplasma centrale TaxID=769 RepID=UPI0011D05317|nr:hypothetical protein [Anaplasma centrale]
MSTFCRKSVVFEIDKDSPDGIKLRDIAGGACSEYKGSDLRGVLQHAVRDQETGEYLFPEDGAPACFASRSGSLFYGHNDTLYPVRYLSQQSGCTISHKVLPVFQRKTNRAIVMGTDLVTSGPHANDVIFERGEPSGGVFKLRLLLPSVASRSTRRMNPTRIALLSPYVVSHDHKSAFMRCYLALIVSGTYRYSTIIPPMVCDIHENAREFRHVITHKRHAASEGDMELLARIVERAQRTYHDTQFRCSRAERAAFAGYISLLLGLLQSEEVMFKPITKQSKLWLVSEFICSAKFQCALVVSAVASVRRSLDRGITSKAGIMARMPYLCRQIPGLCEGVYALARVVIDGVYEQGSLSNLTLHLISQAGDTPGALPIVSEDLAFEGMNEDEIQHFKALVLWSKIALWLNCQDDVFSIIRAEIRRAGRRILQDSHCSDIIAFLAVLKIQRFRMESTLQLDTVSVDTTAGVMIADYIFEESPGRDSVFARGTVLELANKQRCEVFYGTETQICERGTRRERVGPASETLLCDPVVAAAVAESRTAGPLSMAAS